MSIPYNRNWKLQEGVYYFKIFFYEKDGDLKSTAGTFPLLTDDGDILTKEDFIYRVVIDAIDKINSLNFGVIFEYAGEETTHSDSFDEGIHYVSGVQSMAIPSSTNGLAIRMGLMSGASIKGYIGVLHHEILHNLGFAHKDVLIGEDNHRFASRHTLSNDDISGIDVKYKNPSSRIISGNIETRVFFDQMMAYLVNPDGVLCYQSPVWTEGSYEFRLRNKKKYSLLVLGYRDQENLYSLDRGKSWKLFTGKIGGITDRISFITNKAKSIFL